MPTTLSQKKNRLLAALTGLLIFLVIASRLISSDNPTSPVFSELDSQSVDTIVIDTPDHPALKFEKSDNGWYLIEPFKRKTDISRIQILLATLSIPKGTLYSEEDINSEQAGLAPARATLTLNSEQFHFGNKEVNGDRRYLKTGNKISLAPDIIYPLFSQGVIGFVEKNLIPPGVVKLQTPRYSLDKSSGKWLSEELNTADAESLIAIWLGHQIQEIVSWPLDDESLINNAIHQYVNVGTSSTHSTGLEFFILPELILVHPEKEDYAMIITPEQFTTLNLDKP